MSNPPGDSKSRIQDIPDISRIKKRSTGIVGLDKILDGGYPQGSIIMVYGEPTTGLDLLAQQFWKVEGEEGTYLVNDGDVDTGMVEVPEIHPEMYLPQMIGSRLVVDSLSAIIMKYGIDEVLKFLRHTREEIRNRGANLIFVVYDNVHPPFEMSKLQRISDIVIELTTNIQHDTVVRSLIVHKIKDSAVPERTLPYIITDRGIEASTTSRVV